VTDADEAIQNLVAGMGACVKMDCTAPPVPGGVFCAAHQAPSRPGIVEPQAERAAQRAAAALEAERAAAARTAGTGVTSPSGPRPAPDPTAMEPHWDGTQWVLRPKETPVHNILETAQEYRKTMVRIRSLVRELMAEVGIEERDDE
jgi:hypothetical protein